MIGRSCEVGIFVGHLSRLPPATCRLPHSAAASVSAAVSPTGQSAMALLQSATRHAQIAKVPTHNRMPVAQSGAHGLELGWRCFYFQASSFSRTE